jgi:glutathione synthase/RimK-type ligase-like ATP-grasp enzyme
MSAANFKKSIDVAIATCDQFPHLTADDSILKAALEKEGVVIAVWSWTDFSAPWHQCKLVLVRTVWDYTHGKHDLFLQWVARVSQCSTLVNDGRVLIASSDKSIYIPYLANAGVPVPWTVVIEKGSSVDELIKICKKKRLSTAVLKAAVGSFGENCLLLHGLQDDIDSKIRKKIDVLLQERRVLLQEFMPSVKSRGELSLVFVDEQFIFCLQKIPLRSEFKVFLHIFDEIR